MMAPDGLLRGDEAIRIAAVSRQPDKAKYVPCSYEKKFCTIFQIFVRLARERPVHPQLKPRKTPQQCRSRSKMFNVMPKGGIG